MEGGALDRSALRPQPTAVQLDDPAGDRQSKTRPAHSRLQSMKALEDAFDLTIRDRWSIILHREQHLAVVDAAYASGLTSMVRRKRTT